MSQRIPGFIAALSLLFLAGCQSITPPATGVDGWSVDDPHFKTLRTQDSGSNGIRVEEPEIYDDSSLRLILENAQARLAAINSLGEAAITGRLGALSGSRIDQTQIGVQVTGPSIPGTTTVANGATTQTTANSGSGTTPPSSTVVTTVPSPSVTTTVPAGTPPTLPSTPAGPAFTAPTAFSGNALDLLSESMQLTNQIAGLRLMLEGPISARFVRNQRLIKPRATIGFPITITPQDRYKNAVAVVEVEVTTTDADLSDAVLPDPPIITVLLPQEETHNVAGLTDRTTSIGAGAVIGAIGVSGNFMRARRNMYVVQDQDTIAIQRPLDPKTEKKESATSFAWEFRPVLGREFVRSGMKHAFVQIAFPVLDSDCIGTMAVRTYWRRFDQKTGLAGEVVEGSVLKRTQLFPIPKYDLTPFIDDVTYKDLGDGSVLVNVASTGGFLTGTYVQLGPTRYDVSNGLRMEEAGLTFVAPAAALARWTGQVVSRDGTKVDLLNVAVRKKLKALNQLACIGKEVQPLPVVPSGEPCASMGSIVINEVILKPLNENETQVHVDLTSTVIDERDFDGILLAIGGKVFGLTDTQVRRAFRKGSIKDAGVIAAIVPTSLLVKGQQVRAFRPFWTAPDGEQAGRAESGCFNSSKELQGFELDSAVERLVLVEVDKDGNAKYLLYGNGLGNAVVIPEGTATLSPVGGLSQDRVRLLTVTKERLPTIKKLVLQKGSAGRPLVLDLPKPEAKPAEPPKVTLDSPVVQNTDELDVAVERVGDLKSVKIGSKVLKATLGKDSIRLTNLRADGVTTEQKAQELTFEFNDGTSVKVKLEVVAARVGVTGGAPPISDR